MTRAVSPNQNPINISTILTYFTELQYTHTDHTIPEMRKLRAYPVNQSLYRSHTLSVSPTREIFTPKWRLQLRASACLTRNFLCNIHTRRRSISRNFTRNSNSDKSSIYNTHTAAKEIHISWFYTSRRCFSFFTGEYYTRRGIDDIKPAFTVDVAGGYLSRTVAGKVSLASGV